MFIASIPSTTFFLWPGVLIERSSTITYYDDKTFIKYLTKEHIYWSLQPMVSSNTIDIPDTDIIDSNISFVRLNIEACE